tara:strand:- start:491 stop:805 length:315 start_codon:yes stop_codon:yes gene_type:complete
MKDNNGNDLMDIHESFIDDIRDVRANGNTARISGFTRYQAEGFWFDDTQAYVDDIKIYEFHVENKHFGEAYAYLWKWSYYSCRDMEQECIYLQANNETELVRYK